MRECRWCGKGIDHLGPNALHCNEACKHSFGRNKRPRLVDPLSVHSDQECLKCGASLRGRVVTTKFCNVNCRTGWHYTNKGEERAEAKVIRLSKKCPLLNPIPVLHEYKRCRECGDFFTGRNSQAMVCSPRCGKIWDLKTPTSRMAAKRRKHKRRTMESGSLSAQDWAEILDRNDYRCSYCGDPWEEVDHVLPVKLGGPLSYWNVTPSCKRCNQRKSATHPLEWYMRINQVGGGASKGD